MSWALIAHGIDRGCFLAASKDIREMLDTLDPELANQLCVFPESTDDPGVYLWTGSIKVDGDDVECIGHASAVKLDQLDGYLRHDGDEKVST